MNKEICISLGNMKLGKIYNISLPPIKSCASNLPCYAKCYARKAYRMYPSTKKAWDKNYELYKSNPGRYFQLINEFLTNKKPEYFRFHVAGDFPDIQYLHKVLELVDNHKDIKFLAFTKRFDLVKLIDKRPANLSIVLSAWPNLPIDKELRKKYHVAWMLDKKNIDTRISKNAYKCPSDCQKCNKMCWKLAKKNRDVVFKVH